MKTTCHYNSIILVLLSIFLWGCSDKEPDYSLPYEYIDAVGFTVSGERSSKVNHRSYSFSAESTLFRYRKNFFQVGKHECVEFLKNISMDDIRLSVRVYNYSNQDRGYFKDKPVTRVVLQCVQSQGRDEECIAKMEKAVREIDDETARFIILSNMDKACTVTSPISEPVEFSLNALMSKEGTR